MENFKLGFIGCGKMASAIIKGVIDAKLLSKENIFASVHNKESVNKKHQELGINVYCDNKKLVQITDVIFISTKPNQVEDVLSETENEITKDKLIVSICAGVKTEKIEKYTKVAPVIRVMPNAPLMVQMGMSAIVKGAYAKDEHVEVVKNIFEKLGKCIITTEDKIDIATAISGSGPAFFYKIIHEMALAGEILGMEYNDALLLAEQTAFGSANLMMKSELTPIELINNISTKGGCTEVGVSVMNENYTDKIFGDVIIKTTQKAKALGD